MTTRLEFISKKTRQQCLSYDGECNSLCSISDRFIKTIMCESILLKETAAKKEHISPKLKTSTHF